MTDTSKHYGKQAINSPTSAFQQVKRGNGDWYDISMPDHDVLLADRGDISRITFTTLSAIQAGIPGEYEGDVAVVNSGVMIGAIFRYSGVSWSYTGKQMTSPRLEDQLSSGDRATIASELTGLQEYSYYFFSASESGYYFIDSEGSRLGPFTSGAVGTASGSVSGFDGIYVDDETDFVYITGTEDDGSAGVRRYDKSTNPYTKSAATNVGSRTVEQARADRATLSYA